MIWVMMLENLSKVLFEQQRLRPACASVPLLFEVYNVLYLDLLQANFKFSS